VKILAVRGVKECRGIKQGSQKAGRGLNAELKAPQRLKDTLVTPAVGQSKHIDTEQGCCTNTRTAGFYRPHEGGPWVL
jgi:hypothetical protein